MTYISPSQIALPRAVRPEQIVLERTLGGSIDLCAKVGGYALDKTLQLELGVDKSQLSRWQSGTEGILWPKLNKLMDTCGNDAPLLWMLYQRGYDLHSLRKQETEIERVARELREENAALRRALMAMGKEAA